MATDTALHRDELLARIDELGPRFRERSAQYDREAAFPYANYDDLRDAGLLGVCIPARHGGLGASFADYMHLSARLGEYCAMTALTFNMHCQTVLWTGLVADELDMDDAERARHEEVRADLYRRILESGEIMSQPLSEGVARGATAGVLTEATPVDGGWHVTGRKIFASLSGAASAYNLTVKVPGEEQVRFVSVRAKNPGVKIVGDWDTLGMRGTDSRTLLFEDAFVPYADELLPAGVYDQLAERWPYVYMTLTPTYIGLTRSIVEFVRAYLAGGPRRDIPQKQAGWADIQIAYERADALWQRVVAEARIDPTPEQLRRAWAATFTVMETAPEVASKAIRVCGGSTIMRTMALEQHYRDARCGSLMLPWSAEVCLERLGRFGLYDDEG
jgi:alkylation response protein AidB-like acyl-CoA dehydrogenase